MIEKVDRCLTTAGVKLVHRTKFIDLDAFTSSAHLAQSSIDGIEECPVGVMPDDDLTDRLHVRRQIDGGGRRRRCSVGYRGTPTLATKPDDSAD